VRVVRADARHVARIRHVLRHADWFEVLAATGREPSRVVDQAYAMSGDCRAVERDGRAVALFGVASCPGRPGVGLPWLLGSGELESLGWAFFRRARAYLEAMHREYAVLEGRVHADNHRAVSWLERLGFVLGEPRICGPLGEEFRTFWRERDKREGEAECANPRA
jgi:hypothetical protein